MGASDVNPLVLRQITPQRTRARNRSTLPIPTLEPPPAKADPRFVYGAHTLDTPGRIVDRAILDVLG
ncbi:hypothetical protein ACLMAL_18890 [Nocardia sp. CWNU-33]